MTAPWIEALDTQLELLRFWKSPRGEAYLRGWAESAKIPEDSLLSAIYYSLTQGETYWVSPDMMTLNETSHPTVPGHELRVSDLPSPAGFVLLPRPLMVTDSRDITLGCRAFSWTSAGGTSENPSGVNIAYYCRRGDDQESQVMDFPWTLIHLQAESFGSMRWADPTRYDSENQSAIENTINIFKFVVAFWAHVQEELLRRTPTVQTIDGHLDRAVAKRAQRSGFTTDRIRVVVLRRERKPWNPSTEPNGDSSPYSHRFWVRGHWRWQWYPSRGQNERIHIAPYIKGPEDGPLLDSDHVYVWKR